MTNADKFKQTFGQYATEIWSLPETDFLKWLNSDDSNRSTSAWDNYCNHLKNRYEGD